MSSTLRTCGNCGETFSVKGKEEVSIIIEADLKPICDECLKIEIEEGIKSLEEGGVSLNDCLDRIRSRYKNK